MIRKTILIGSLMMAPFFLIAQNAPNTIDANGMKQGEWAKYNTEGKIIYKGAFENDIPVGTFTYYFENGKQKAVMTYNPDIVDEATAVTYHRNGKKSAMGVYMNKKRHGLWKFFDEEENMISEETYVNGIKTGLWKVYYFDGTINEETTYAEDHKNGPWKQYFTDGRIKLQGTYVNDLLEGEAIYYHPDGKVMIRGSYIKNLKNGKWVFFDEDGKMVQEQEYEMGRLLEDPEKK